MLSVERKTPMLVSFLAIGSNLLLNWLFTFRLGWGHRGLAFSTSLVATINFLFALLADAASHATRLETLQMLRRPRSKLCVAGGALAVVCWAANYWWLDAWQSSRFVPRLVALLITIAVGVTTFFSIAFLLRVKASDTLSILLGANCCRGVSNA